MGNLKRAKVPSFLKGKLGRVKTQKCVLLTPPALPGVSVVQFHVRQAYSLNSLAFKRVTRGSTNLLWSGHSLSQLLCLKVFHIPGPHCPCTQEFPNSMVELFLLDNTPY